MLLNKYTKYFLIDKLLVIFAKSMFMKKDNKKKRGRKKQVKKNPLEIKKRTIAVYEFNNMENDNLDK